MAYLIFLAIAGLVLLVFAVNLAPGVRTLDVVGKVGGRDVTVRIRWKTTRFLKVYPREAEEFEQFLRTTAWESFVKFSGEPEEVGKFILSRMKLEPKMWLEVSVIHLSPKPPDPAGLIIGR